MFSKFFTAYDFWFLFWSKITPYMIIIISCWEFFLMHSIWFTVVKAPLERNVYSLVGCSILWTSIRSRWLTVCSDYIFADFLGGVSCSTSSYKMLKSPTTIVELYVPPPFCSFNFCFMYFWSSVIRHIPIYDYFMFPWWLRW